MDEPSVLDYVKSRLMPWKYPRLSIPENLRPAWPSDQEPLEAEANATHPGTTSAAGFEKPKIQPGEAETETARIVPPWRLLGAIVLALAAQASLAPGPGRAWQPGAILLVLAIAFLGWAAWREDWQLAPAPERILSSERPVINLPFLLAAIATGLVAFFSFASLQFIFINTTLLLVTFLLGVLAFRAIPESPQVPAKAFNLKGFFSTSQIGIRFSWRWVGILAAIATVFFFRYYRLGSVPPEMNSDHAEKIVDVLNVLKGQTGIFFPSNGGREALQFYLVAGLNKYLHIPLGYNILKLVTITAGFLTLPFIYLIGKEIGNRRVGWLAFTFAGIAYWPNVVSRVGLRLPFYMLFTAATLYFLLRGLQRGRRNDFLYAGIVLGISFYGYSANRILPLCVLAAIGLFLIHRQATGQRTKTIISTLTLVFMAFLIFLPLLRYMLAEPEGFFFRTLTRMGSLERPLDEPAGIIFLSNLWNALKMFSWSGGVVWPISIPDYPAMGIIIGGLFYLGVALVVLRYLRQRMWVDLFLLISIPILMLPSILSLAFPAENPNLYRTGGVVVPAFLLVGLALDSIMSAIENRYSHPTGMRLAWGLAIFLLTLSAIQEYDLVFHKYYEQYRLSAWNSSEMGRVANDFIELTGSPDTVWVVGFPHWVDTRLVALNAGYPGEDFQILPEFIDTTRQDGGPKLFMLNPKDELSLAKLMALYPTGWSQVYHSKVESKDFIVFQVPPALLNQP